MTSSASFAPRYTDFFEGTDAFPLERQHRLLHGLPGRRFIALEVTRRMWHDGETLLEALTALPSNWQPCCANSLPQYLWDKSSLIDFDHWADVNEALRRKGVKLPCDEIANVESLPTDSTRSSCTVTQGSAATSEASGAQHRSEHRSEVEDEMVGDDGERDQGLHLLDSEEATRLRVRSLLQLLQSYGHMALAILQKCLTGEV